MKNGNTNYSIVGSINNTTRFNTTEEITQANRRMLKQRTPENKKARLCMSQGEVKTQAAILFERARAQKVDMYEIKLCEIPDINGKKSHWGKIISYMNS